MHNWKRIVQERLAPLRLDAGAEQDLVDELSQHLEDRERELRSGGTAEVESYKTAMAELDDLYPLRAELTKQQFMPTQDAVAAGDARPGNVLEDLWRDLRYAVRTMRKSPAFVLFIVLTLALGIGANTAVFTVINTLVLNPLPVHDSAGLAAVVRAEAKSASKPGAQLAISYVDLKDYQAWNSVFRSLAGYTSPRPITWQAKGGSQGMFSEFVTANYFPTLGLGAARGRFFLPEEDGAPGAHPVAVMNYGTWQSRFGGAADVVGKTLALNGVEVTVVGIAPPGFIGLNAVFGPDLWVPTAMTERLLANQMQGALTDRGKADFQLVGRLKPGVSRAQAEANMAAIASRLAREYPSAEDGHTVTVRPILDALFASSFGASTPVVLASVGLLIVVGIVLLIACSNVANLLMARAAVRRQEMAVRLAMGASRRRLVRQLLTESMLLGVVSGACGLLIAAGGLRLLFGMFPSGANFPAPKLDASVFAFAMAISLATGFVFGIIPAFHASGASVGDALKEAARTSGRSRRRIGLASALLVGQVAFSFLLLVTASLFLRSMQRAYNLDPGFQTAHLAIFPTNPGQAGYGKVRAKAFYKDVRERVGRLPAVESASWASGEPLWARAESGLLVEGRSQRSRTDSLSAVVKTVDLRYFDTAGIGIETGRVFTDADQETSTPVAIINEKMSHDNWPAGDAVGKRIRLPGERHLRQIVGIVRTSNYSSWGEAPQACIYVPMEQNYSDGMFLFVRSKGDPEQIMMEVRREIVASGPEILISRTLAGSGIIDAGLFQARMGVALLTVFGLLALGLASIGLYGIMAYSVNQRKREIGLRMALGAAPGSVLKLILSQAMSLVFTGVLIGFAAAIWTSRLLGSLLYGMSGSDPVSVGGAAAVLLAVALVACYLPARRASGVDPLVALREG